MSDLIDDDGRGFPVSFDVIVIGAGACGLVAALSAHDAGASVVVLERDAIPAGSTALSSGMITACGTALQKAAGIDDDTPELFAADIQSKAGGKADPELLAAICAQSGPTIDWLVSTHHLDLVLVPGAPYPGHSRQRTHAPPSQTGTELMADLQRAVADKEVDIVTNAHAESLFRIDDRITGVAFRRPDGGVEHVGCQALVLASSGFGGDRELVGEFVPDMAEALYFGHAGNTGDAVRWGQALGAACRHMGSFQGHGSVATPHAITVSWALMKGGGILVNSEGNRFADEMAGASEVAAAVCSQPGGTVWAVIGNGPHERALRFPEYRQLADLGAIKDGGTAGELASACHLPEAALAATLAAAYEMAGGDESQADGLQPPYHAIRVTGALLQTQGGLAINNEAQVCRDDGAPLPNLFAGGGAAQGISGVDGAGYLSCNGLLSAVTLGHIAGRQAADRC